MSTIKVNFVQKQMEKKKLLFVIVFFAYLLMGSPKFIVLGLVGCGIKFRIQSIPTLHTSEVPTTPKNENFNKKSILILKYFFY